MKKILIFLFLWRKLIILIEYIIKIFFHRNLVNFSSYWCRTQNCSIVEILILIFVFMSVDIRKLINVLLIFSEELIKVIIWLILFFSKSFFEAYSFSEHFILSVWLLNGSCETLHVFEWRWILISDRWTIDLLWWLNFLFLLFFIVEHLLCESSTICLVLLLGRNLLSNLFFFFFLDLFGLLFFLLGSWLNNVLLRFIIHHILGTEGIILFSILNVLIGLLRDV